MVALIAASGQAYPEDDFPEPELNVPECVECGNWIVDWATNDTLAGVAVTVSADSISVPGCGRFKTEKTEETRRGKGRETEYRMTFQLTQSSEEVLCPQDEWRLELQVSGHFRIASVAEFNLWRPDEKEMALGIHAWNLDREDPCDAGSGFGSNACLLIHNSRLQKVLANEVGQAYEIQLTGNKKARAFEFNLARYLKTLREACGKAHQNSGGGSWPQAWSLGCQSELMQSKYLEMKEWNRCTQASGPSGSRCEMPTEKFEIPVGEEGSSEQ